MAEIEIVIKIPEETYQKIKETNMVISGRRNGIRLDYILFSAVNTGTPLPKGHGNLKDMGNLPYIFDLTRDDPIYSGTDIERAVNSMKSIIEADN